MSKSKAWEDMRLDAEAARQKAPPVPPAKWAVSRGSLLTQTHGKMTISCTHRQQGACGGCFARLYIAMQIIEKTPEAADIIVKEVFDAMRAENAAARLRGEAKFL